MTKPQSINLLTQQTIRRLEHAAVVGLWMADAALFGHALTVTKKLWEITEHGPTDQRRHELAETLEALADYLSERPELMTRH